MPSSEPEPDPGAANLAIFTGGLAAFSASRFQEGAAVMHPDVEWHVAFRLPDLPFDEEVIRGRDKVVRLWETFHSAWDELVIELEEVLEAKGDLIIARVRFRGRGSVSGIEVDRSLFYVADIEGGLLRRMRPFENEETARAEADRTTPGS